MAANLYSVAVLRVIKFNIFPQIFYDRRVDIKKHVYWFGLSQNYTLKKSLNTI